MRNSMAVMFLLIVFSALYSCKVEGNSADKKAAATYTLLNTSEVKKLMAENKDLLIIDVRTPEETKAGILPGAINLDFNAPDFEQNIDKLEKSRPTLIYCQAGGRSKKVTDRLLGQKGFSSVYELKGGYNEWIP